MLLGIREKVLIKWEQIPKDQGKGNQNGKEDGAYYFPGAGYLGRFIFSAQGALGIRNQQVFHLLLDMLDAEETQSVKKSVRHSCHIPSNSFYCLFTVNDRELGQKSSDTVAWLDSLWVTVTMSRISFQVLPPFLVPAQSEPASRSLFPCRYKRHYLFGPQATPGSKKSCRTRFSLCMIYLKLGR